MNKLTSVTQVGTIPPPIGGVSVHILRLIRALREKQIGARLLDLHWHRGKTYDKVIRDCTRGERLLMLLSYWGRVLGSQELLHHHASRFKSFVIMNCVMLLGWKRSKVVVTFHTGERLPARGSVGYRLLLLLLRRVDAIICVSDELHGSICDAMSEDPEKLDTIFRISPYICDRETGNLTSAHRLVTASPEGTTRIVVSGYGRPIYNWGFICSLIEIMPLEIEWVCCIYGGRDEDYWPGVKLELSKHENVVFYEDLDSERFAATLASASVYFRPTECDGDSVTIHEAQAAGILCVASDVIVRPRGVICYAHNNVSDCRDKLLSAASSAKDVNFVAEPRRDREVPERTSTEQIIEVYKRVVKFRAETIGAASMASNDLRRASIK